MNDEVEKKTRFRQWSLILFSLGVWQAQSRAGVYAEASAIVYTLGQSRGVTAIAKIAGGLVLLRM
jgi:hypothetical protein